MARLAGVSTSTVSHVLNNTRFVSDDLRERVLAVMQELDFEPNAAARMLTLKRSNTIGLIVSDIRNPFFAALARGVEDVAQECGYTLVLCNSDENAEREMACLKALQTRQVDGILLASAKPTPCSRAWSTPAFRSSWSIASCPSSGRAGHSDGQRRRRLRGRAPPAGARTLPHRDAQRSRFDFDDYRACRRLPPRAA